MTGQTGQQQPLTREGLAKLYQWNSFPQSIQEKLYQHYLTYTHNGESLQRADIQSVSDTLSWVSQGQPLARFVGDHLQYFGTESTGDLKRLAQELTQLKQGEQVPPQT